MSNRDGTSLHKLDSTPTMYVPPARCRAVAVSVAANYPTDAARDILAALGITREVVDKGMGVDPAIRLGGAA